MIGGILAFLTQWLALSQFGSKSSIPSQEGYGMANSAFLPAFSASPSFPPRSHWTLLTELQELPEEEIEGFLPQICNMVLDRASLNDGAVFDHFERILVHKCADCLPFGTRLCNTLKVCLLPFCIA